MTHGPAMGQALPHGAVRGAHGASHVRVLHGGLLHAHLHAMHAGEMAIARVRVLRPSIMISYIVHFIIP